MNCCETILRTLREIQPATSLQVIAATGIKKATVQSLLPRLASYGKVRRTGTVRHADGMQGPHPYLWELASHSHKRGNP